MCIGGVAPFAAYLTVGLADSEGKKRPSGLILEPGLLRRIKIIIIEFPVLGAHWLLLNRIFTVLQRAWAQTVTHFSKEMKVRKEEQLNEKKEKNLFINSVISVISHRMLCCR